MALPEVGERLTRVWLFTSGAVELLQGHLDRAVGPFSAVFRASDGLNKRTDCLSAYEGSTWIRGHFDKDSEEGKALLIAYVLTLSAWSAPR